MKCTIADEAQDKPRASKVQEVDWYGGLAGFAVAGAVAADVDKGEGDCKGGVTGAGV
jgi:hypothetical protein